MNKKILMGTLGAAIIFGGAFAVGAVDNDKINPANTGGSNEKAMLSLEEVEKIALKEVEGVVESIELERESGREVYDVDMEKGHDDDYDIHIDAYTGEVYSVDRDDNHDDDRDDQEIASNSNAKLISQDEAVTIAEKKVNGKMVEIDLDEDDGQRVYEVELRTDKGEAEVDIDATNGTIIKVEWDD